MRWNLNTIHPLPKKKITSPFEAVLKIFPCINLFQGRIINFQMKNGDLNYGLKVSREKSNNARVNKRKN